MCYNDLKKVFFTDFNSYGVHPGFQAGRLSRCSIFGFLCNVLQIVVCLFVLFDLVIVLSVVLRFTDSDYYSLGIFRLFSINLLVISCQNNLFVTVKRLVPLLEQDLFTLPDHLTSPTVLRVGFTLLNLCLSVWCLFAFCVFHFCHCCYAIFSYMFILVVVAKVWK